MHVSFSALMLLFGILGDKNGVRPVKINTSF